MRFFDLKVGENYEHNGTGRKILALSGQEKRDMIVYECTKQSPMDRRNLAPVGSRHTCTYKTFCEWLSLPDREADNQGEKAAIDFTPASFKKDIVE